MPDLRFTPPSRLRIADRATGLNAGGVRSYNERLLLSLLLQNEGMTRLAICDKTGLSAQSISVLLRSLEKEGLVLKLKAPREQGRIGPPTTPASLNPKGAYSIGISESYATTELVIINFIGEVQFQTVLNERISGKKGANPQLIKTLENIIKELPKETQERLVGIGLALPEINQEEATQNLALEEAYKSIQDEIENTTGHAVFVQHDISAIAGGESMFGAAKPLSDYLFFYLGAKLHGRLVLDHQIHNGNFSPSFDVGLLNLQEKLKEHNLPFDHLWKRHVPWPTFNDLVNDWQKQLMEQMSKSIESLALFVKLDSVILSSSTSNDICKHISSELEKNVPNIKAIAGNVKSSPKVIGAASLPISSRFMIDR